MTRVLQLAAAPVFVLMALLSVALGHGHADALCMGSDHLGFGSMGLGEMTPMYLLMAVFHSTPWLQIASRRHIDI